MTNEQLETGEEAESQDTVEEEAVSAEEVDTTEEAEQEKNPKQGTDSNQLPRKRNLTASLPNELRVIVAESKNMKRVTKLQRGKRKYPKNMVCRSGF